MQEIFDIMASIKENYNLFAIEYNWPERGDEWSQPWGGTRYLWNMTIFPRIQSFVPSKNILEIAPGFGRCTQFLKDFCDNLIVVDISEKCIRACQERFRECSTIKYHINDGKSLDMISDQSIDFIFSWDSLVHADKSVMEAYILQFSRILKPGGYGFIHHSNLSEYRDKRTGKLKYENLHFRDETMDSSLFLKYSHESGLHCILQEKINWRGTFLNDCLSVFTFKNKMLGTPTKVVENYNFMEEAKIAKYISDTYTF
jgi:ubiquinone/menaquinone biosynthesis C-methylase UbiE